MVFAVKDNPSKQNKPTRSQGRESSLCAYGFHLMLSVKALPWEHSRVTIINRCRPQNNSHSKNILNSVLRKENGSLTESKWNSSMVKWNSWDEGFPGLSRALNIITKGPGKEGAGELDWSRCEERNRQRSLTQTQRREGRQPMGAAQGVKTNPSPDFRLLISRAVREQICVWSHRIYSDVLQRDGK